jgi:efflux transporter, outer membrane factor (OMF) lipoprotein, NodT family
MKRGIAGILLLTFFPACAVGPKYQRPKVQVPDSFRGQGDRASAQAQEMSFGDLPWWDVFQDAQLQDLIRKALEKNKDLKIAAARIEEARGLYRAKRGDQFPQLGFVTSGAQTFTTKNNVDDEGNLGNINRTYAAVGIDLSYEADLWGRYRRGTEAARADLLAQEEFRRTVIITLLSDVARAYFELRSLDLELAIAKSTTSVRGRSLDLTQKRLKGGVVSLLDVRQAEAEMAISATQIPRIEREIGLKENEISLLLGENPQSIPRGQSLSSQSIPPILPLDLPSVLLERRPDIRSAEQQLIAANARIGEAKAMFFPQINLSSIVGMAFVTGAFGGATGVASLGGSLFQFLFDGGKRKGNLEAAKARFDQALLKYEQVIQQSLREVSDSLISIKKLAEMRRQQEKLVRAARDGFRLANARYEGGVSSYLEVLDAQRILFRSELELVGIRRDQWVAVVQLYRSMGGGWETIQPETQPSAQGEKTISKREKIKILDE